MLDPRLATPLFDPGDHFLKHFAGDVAAIGYQSLDFSNGRVGVFFEQ
jgi:hypothetical protein